MAEVEGPSPRRGLIHEFLEADHARLAGLIEAACSGSDIDVAIYERFRGGLLRHIGIEEKILIPAARALDSRLELSVTRQLKLDHSALAALLVPTPTRAIVDRLRGLLALHNALEEGPTGLYAACERILGAESSNLFERMMRTPPVALAPFHDGPRALAAIERQMRAAGRE